eukprot:jgi/Picsp_1/5468/NSC_02827-R1_chloroplast -like protein
MELTCCSQGLRRFQWQNNKRLVVRGLKHDLYGTGMSIKEIHYTYRQRSLTVVRRDSTMSDQRNIGRCTAVASHHGHTRTGSRPFVLGHARYPRSITCRSVEDWQVADGAEVDEEGGFYSVFGVSPGASKAEIKKAYRKLMKDYHPDQSNDEALNEFAIFINQAYEILIDDEARAEYNIIAGFSVSDENPFAVMNSLYPPEYSFVDEFSCIGCRNCVNCDPKTFAMENEHGRARVQQQGLDPERVQEAIETCPVNCIHWVTAPQLTLLEEAMGRMERIDAWLLMTGGGKGANLSVFYEASLQWAKRQSVMRDAENKAKWAWFQYGPAAGSQATASSSSDDSSRQEAPRSRTAKNASSMVNTARKWRDYQRSKKEKNRLLISD